MTAGTSGLATCTVLGFSRVTSIEQSLTHSRSQLDQISYAFSLALLNTQALRIACRLSFGVLFIPILNNLLMPIACPGSTWLSTGWACYSGAHAAVLAVGMCLLAVFFPAALICEYMVAVWVTGCVRYV